MVEFHLYGWETAPALGQALTSNGLYDLPTETLHFLDFYTKR